jgi:hemerythrin-like domain-containing protein
MLQGIKPANQPKPESAVELLTACHTRIRHFTSVLRNLAHAEGTSLEEISRAASSAHRYFSIALPLHEVDEEESVRPRLMELGDAAVNGALEAMTHQHQAVDDLTERLLPLLVLLSNHPAKLSEVHAEVCALSSALSDVFSGHLQLEETMIFPAMAEKLSSAAQADVLREMQQRRKQA